MLTSKGWGGVHFGYLSELGHMQSCSFYVSALTLCNVCMVRNSCKDNFLGSEEFCPVGMTLCQLQAFKFTHAVITR